MAGSDLSEEHLASYGLEHVQARPDQASANRDAANRRQILHQLYRLGLLLPVLGDVREGPDGVDRGSRLQLPSHYDGSTLEKYGRFEKEQIKEQIASLTPMKERYEALPDYSL